MYRDLKFKETLQASFAIKNLNIPPNLCVSSPPQPDQLAKLKILGNLREVLSDLQDIQPCLSQVWNCDEIGFDTNGSWSNIICTYTFFPGELIWSTHTGEISPFWCISLIFSLSYVSCFFPPVSYHKSTHYTQYLHYNIPSDWIVQNLPSGYHLVKASLKTRSQTSAVIYTL